MTSYIERASQTELERMLKPNKVLILLGARRTGKTRLIHRYLQNIPQEQYLLLNGDDVHDVRLLEERSVKNYSRLLAGTDLLVIDEAQHIRDIGLILKLIVDTIGGIKVLVTGSSVFDLSNRLGEPLVGRKTTIFLYPLSQIEFSKVENYKATMENLEERLLFGGYPELVQYPDWREKEEYLYEIINSYLLKDILIYENIRQSDKIYDLLRLIAFQIGKEVSILELSNQLNIARNTVESYLNLLSKVFILFKVEGFSRNLRKEITKSSRWFFYDNGIRNGLIRNFNPLSMRQDTGSLWENYLATERIKKQHYQHVYTNNYFWRTYDQQELDWLEESADQLNGFEFKWSERKIPKVPVAFKKAYAKASFQVINRQNYLDFIT